MLTYPRRRNRNPLGALLAAAALLAVAGCTSSAGSAESMTVRDPWVKAAESGMTAAFGTFVNDSAEPLTVVAASCAAADRMELHETATGDDGTTVMREVADGFVVPADGERELAPGGDHLMLMSIGEAIEPGDEIEITLELADGSEVMFTASARSFAGAEETYEDHDTP